MRDARPAASTIDAVELLAALESADWLVPDQVRDRPSSARTRWRWVVPPRTAVRSAFTDTSPELTRRFSGVAADWYETHGAPAAALRHAVAAGSWSRLVDIVESHWPHLIFEHPGTLTRALRRVPVAALSASPLALAFREILPVLPPSRMPIPPLMTEAEVAAVARSPRVGHALEVSLAVMVVLRRRGSYPQAQAYGEQLDALRLASISHRSGGVSNLAPIALMQSAILSELAGESAEANEQLHYAYRFTPTGPFRFGRAEVAARLALSYAMLGILDTASTWLARVEEEAPPRGLMAASIRATAQLADATIAIAQLDRPRADRALAAVGAGLAGDEYWLFGVRARTAYVLAWGDRAEVRTHLEVLRARSDRPDSAAATGNGGVAGPLLAAVEADLRIALGLGNEARATLDGQYDGHRLLDEPRARLALLTGDNHRARDLALTAIDRPMVLSPLQRLSITLIIAVASHRLGRSSDAADALRRAVHQANLLTVLQPFGRLPRADLLAIAEWVPEAKLLLCDERLRQTSEPGSAPIVLITLSKREQVILRSFQRGSSVAQIAAELSVSINTVRSQRRILYQKLGVTSRDDAVNVAIKLGLTQA
jgi:LuxR family transcriptional regulator, maltose regulon positive regulatory protein